MSAEVKPGRLPRAFQSLSTLHALNVASVGLALAAVTSAVFARLWGWSEQSGAMGVIVGLPTLIFGTLWAELLRGRATVGQSRLRWGWVASLPLAILNGAAACGLLMISDGLTDGRDPLTKFLLGAVLGSTVGAIFWVPGLILTLAFFGIPIAWSQRLAEKGLAGEERGELVVGVTTTILATLALLTTWLNGRMPTEGDVGVYVGHALFWLYGLGGLATGASAAALALRREARRRRFVKEVEAGNVTGFRVDEAPEGKVLVRVTSMGEGYRVANFEEAVFALDEEGEAKRATSPSP